MTLSAPSRSLAAGLAILCLSSASLVAQGALAGTYHLRTVTLELTATGQARFSNAFGPLIVSSYVVAGDTITLRDESGPGACTSGTGRYLWRLDAGALQFGVLSDLCDGRRTSLSMPWTRGAPPASTAAELTPVLITAQRYVEDVQRAPVAITVLPAEILRDAGVTRPQDLTYLTPGLQVGSLVGSSAMLYMRGVGNFGGTSLQDPTVTFNFDGVYIARQTATGGMFYDLERVEVLKGPQGTLYGRNATGGAVNIVPRRPALGELGGELSAEYGESNTLRADGAFNVPLGERAAIRVAGQRVRHDPFMKDGTDDQNDWAGRLSFRYDISDALAVHLVADDYDQGGHGPGSTPIGLGVDSRFGVTSSQGNTYYEGQRFSLAGRNWGPLAPLQHANHHHWGVGATLDWRTALGGLTLVSASRGSHLDGTGTPTGNLFTEQEHSRQNSLEARLASTPLPQLETLVGAFYFKEDIKTGDNELVSAYNLFSVSLQHPRTGVTSAAPFGRITWHVTDRVRTTLGARYTLESKHFGGSFENFQRVCPPVPTANCPSSPPFPAGITTEPLVFPTDSLNAVGVFNPADGTRTVGYRILPNESAKFSRTTWRSALEYDVSERALLYASFETGFKSGGFFFSNDSGVYQPEEVGAFTLGMKSRLFGDRVQANVELFDWHYHDQQVSKVAVDSHGALNLATDNIGQATIRGVEASIEYVPLANTHLSADVQGLDANYDSYTYATPASSGPPNSGCVVTPRSSDYLIDCSGRRSPYAPARTINLSAMQAFPLRRDANLIARIRTHHQSETLVGTDFLQQQQQPSYWTLDASLTVATAAHRHSVSVFGQNLTDRTIMSNTFALPFSTFAVGVLRPPRTIGVRMDARF